MCYITVIMCYLNLRVNIVDLIWFDFKKGFFECQFGEAYDEEEESDESEDEEEVEENKKLLQEMLDEERDYRPNCLGIQSKIEFADDEVRPLKNVLFDTTGFLGSQNLTRKQRDSRQIFCGNKSKKQCFDGISEHISAV